MQKSIFYGILITLLFVFGSLIYIAKKTFTKDFISVLFMADKRYLLLSVFSMFLYHTFDNLRLFILSRAMNLKYSFAYGYVVSFINTFGATITPAHMGGEFMSVYTLSRKGGKLHNVMSVVTMKTLTGFSFFLVAFPFVLYQLYKNPVQSLRILAVLGFFFFLFFVFYVLIRFISRRKFRENNSLTQKVKYTFKRYVVVSRIFLRDKKGSFLLACLSSIFLYVCFLASGAFLVKSFNAEPNMLLLIEHQLMLLYAIFVSPTPGGSGVGEVGALYVFDAFLELSLLGGFSLLWRFITQYASAIIGGILLALLLIKDSRGWSVGRPA
ncbi:MAG: flippase-like domain-containing protein [Aquificaceae bacterium]|nr:flippase-like domain-containing protein [Aquificaceae bacterium]